MRVQHAEVLLLMIAVSFAGCELVVPMSEQKESHANGTRE